MAGRWAVTGDQDFIVTALTNNFDNNKKIALVDQVQQFILYLDYSKGTETTLEIRLKYAHKWDTPKKFYQESIMDIGTQILVPYVFKINASGQYRIPIPVGIQEDQVEVSVRGVGTASGTVNLDFTIDQFGMAP